VDAELPALAAGRTRIAVRPEDRVLVNPFGMATSDVALGAQVDRFAREAGLGVWLRR
jgi:ornithine cyclodeaminase/alanine dehydrogenase-like protein (mu-crystallin family)